MRININSYEDNKKFTMSEFEKMFVNASEEVLKDVNNKINSKNDKGLGAMFFELQNTMIIALLRNKLFNTEKED